MYTCPMHPEIQQPQPGICPKCGMSLETTYTFSQVEHSEYRDMVYRLWIGSTLTIPILVLDADLISPILSGWIQFAFSTPVVFWCGWPFFQRAWQALVNYRALNMFSLISLGVGAAYSYSVVVVLFPGIFPDSFKQNGNLPIYFETASVITILVILGQTLELKAKSQTNRSIQTLLARSPTTAHQLIDGQEHDVAIDQVKVGDLLRVKPGEKVPTDGTVIEGSSFIDESMMTGESMPVEKKAADNVIGGTINQTGSFLMETRKVGQETMLARIVQMVSEAQRSRAPIQRLADSISAYFVPIVLLIAVLTFVFWSLYGPTPRLIFALVNAVSVLIIACPCALGLATPMSIMVGIGHAAELGILVKNAEALERLEQVNTLLIDKTGTLTEGKPRITQILSNSKWTENELLTWAAAIETSSEHPLARAIVQGAQERNLTIPRASQFKSMTGGGVMGVLEDQQVVVGQLKLMENSNVNVSQAKALQEKGQTVIFVAVNGQNIGLIAVADPMKPSTLKAVEDLHKLGLKIVMLTGDNEVTARAVAKSLGIDEVYAGVNPLDKSALVKRLRGPNQVIAMAGDGVNDAPALAAADVGIAMGTGTDVAIESAGVTLMKGDLNGIMRAISLSRVTMRNIRQNLFFAFIYNSVGIPIAAGVLYPFFGLLLNPMIASAAMALSSVSVILNALRLKKEEPKCPHKNHCMKHLK